MKLAPIPADDNQRLAELYRYDILDTETEAEFDDFARLAALICGVPMALVSMVDKERVWFKSGFGYETKQNDRDVSFCGHVILGREVFEIPDATKDERFVDNPGVTGDSAI